MSGWDVLERHFDGLTADEVDAQLAVVLERGATPVAAWTAAYLAEHGGPDLDSDPETEGVLRQRRILTAASTLAETLASALTLGQAAERLGVSASRLSHRLKDGTVWAFTISSRRWLPTWQFTVDQRTLPGLPAIVAAIPASLHPLAVAAFMTTPRPDFGGRSPADWLASGGDPAPVADWLTGMGRE